MQYTFVWWGVGVWSALAFEWDLWGDLRQAQLSHLSPHPRKGAPTEGGVADKPLHRYTPDFSDLYFRKQPRLTLSSKGEQMAHSSCLVWPTPEAMDNAVSVQISSWAQDSWKQLCSNSLSIRGWAVRTMHSAVRVKSLCPKPSLMLNFTWWHDAPALSVSRAAYNIRCFSLKCSQWKKKKIKKPRGQKKTRIYTRRWSTGETRRKKNFRKLQEGILNQCQALELREQEVKRNCDNWEAGCQSCS